MSEQYPKISEKNTKHNVFSARFDNTDVSIINGIRRTIIKDIPVWVFDTDNCKISKNTSRFNNEIIKHRLGMIPIHISDLSFPGDQYKLIVNFKNTSKSVIFVTTEDFELYNESQEAVMDKDTLGKIFPKNDITSMYIDFIRLLPGTQDETLEGQEINLSCKLKISSAKENYSFNVTSTCCFFNRRNPKTSEQAWAEKEKEMTLSKETKAAIAFEKKNWDVHGSYKYYMPGVYIFRVETIGVYNNNTIIKMACDILKENLELSKQNQIIQSETNSIEKCYDIILNNIDGNTIGKIMEYCLYSLYMDNKLLFCGFKKKHPHDNHSYIRIILSNTTSGNTIKLISSYYNNAADKAISILDHVNQQF